MPGETGVVTGVGATTAGVGVVTTGCGTGAGWPGAWTTGVWAIGVVADDVVGVTPCVVPGVVKPLRRTCVCWPPDGSE